MEMNSERKSEGLPRKVQRQGDSNSYRVVEVAVGLQAVIVACRSRMRFKNRNYAGAETEIRTFGIYRDVK